MGISLECIWVNRLMNISSTDCHESWEQPMIPYYVLIKQPPRFTGHSICSWFSIFCGHFPLIDSQQTWRASHILIGKRMAYAPCLSLPPAIQHDIMSPELLQLYQLFRTETIPLGRLRCCPQSSWSNAMQYKTCLSASFIDSLRQQPFSWCQVPWMIHFPAVGSSRLDL